jgi:ferredoxin-NADP reductase
VSSITAPIVGIEPITPRSRLVSVDLHGQQLGFLAGQAVMVAANSLEEGRWYSIACSPDRAAETGCLELLIALEADGSLGPHLRDARVGSTVRLEGPSGSFTLPPSISQTYVLFVAGGTGIAPLRAMIDQMLRREAPARIAVLYSARRGDEFAFIGELRAHAGAGRIKLHETVTRDASWEGPRGRIARRHFEAVLHEPASTLCFVCGPAQLVTESVATLTALGVPLELIRTEQWGV